MYNPNIKRHFEIDYSVYTPICVTAEYTKDGRLLPLSFQVVDQDESNQTVIVNTIKDIKDLTNYFVYQVRYINYGCVRGIELYFFINDNIWCIKR